MTTMQASASANLARRPNLLSEALGLIKTHRRAYLLSNLIFYGLIPVGMGIAFADPSIQTTLLGGVEQATGEGGVLAGVASAYGDQKVVLAVALTFLVNLLLGSFVEISLPSLIVPFLGWVMGVIRALTWGVLFAPSLDQPLTALGVLDGLMLVGLLFLEGQGYVLALFGTVIQGKAFLFHRREGAETRWQGYLLGLKRTGLIYVLVAIVLLIAAIYEVGIVAISQSFS